MNIWLITRKEIKSLFFNKITFFLMLALPIILMLILGTALTNVFSTESKQLNNMKLLANLQTNNAQLSDAWQGFVEMIHEEGVTVDSFQPTMVGQDEVRSNRYTAYVEVKDDALYFYANNKNTIEGQIMQGMLSVFADRYSLIAAAYHVDPSSIHEMVQAANQHTGFIQETALGRDEEPNSMDYYAVVVATMIALYSSIPASELFRGERSRHTSIRLMASPVSKGEIFIGKIIGCTFTNFICVLCVVLFSKFVYGANWGTNYGMILLLLLTIVVFSVSFGLCVSMSIPGKGYAGVLMIFAQLASFLGGAYFPLGEMEGLMKAMTHFSPLEWINTALFNMIYSNELSTAWSAMGLSMSFAALFLVIAIMLMQRREAI